MFSHWNKATERYLGGPILYSFTLFVQPDDWPNWVVCFSLDRWLQSGCPWSLAVFEWFRTEVLVLGHSFLSALNFFWGLKTSRTKTDFPADCFSLVQMTTFLWCSEAEDVLAELIAGKQEQADLISQDTCAKLVGRKDRCLEVKL